VFDARSGIDAFSSAADQQARVTLFCEADNDLNRIDGTSGGRARTTMTVFGPDL